MALLERWNIAVWERDLFTQKKIAMEVLGMCLCYGKKYFQGHQWSTFLSIGQITEIFLVLGNAAFGEIKDHSLRTTCFQKKNVFNGSFRYVSTLRKKVFSRALVKYFSFYGSNYSELLVLWVKLLRFSCFWEYCFWTNQRLKFENDTFSRKKFQWRFWDCVYIMGKGISKSTSEVLFSLSLK